MEIEDLIEEDKHIEILDTEDRICEQEKEECMEESNILDNNINAEKELIEESSTEKINSLFNQFNSDSDVYVTYNVFILREGDSIDSILDKTIFYIKGEMLINAEVRFLYTWFMTNKDKLTINQLATDNGRTINEVKELLWKYTQLGVLRYEGTLKSIV